MSTSRELPPHLWDKCKYCGSIRKERHGTYGTPACFRQGCPGQHTKVGIPLTEEEKARYIK